MRDPAMKHLQEQRTELRSAAHKTKDSQIWEQFHTAHNQLKALIKSAKKSFTQKILS